MPDRSDEAEAAASTRSGRSASGQREEDPEAVIDWRGHVRERPELWLGVAFVGGMLVAGALKTRSGERAVSAVGGSPAAGGWASVLAQASQFWNNMQGALAGVASARLQQYIDDVVPGFNEHYRRVEERSASGNAATASMGRSPR